MAQHLQLKGIRAHLSQRGVHLILRDGKTYVLDRKTPRAKEVLCEDSEDAYFRGLRIASVRDSVNDIAAHMRAA